MTVSIRFMYKSYTQCQKVRKGSLTEKRKRDRSMSKGHRSELKVLKGRAVPSPPFICLLIIYVYQCVLMDIYSILQVIILWCAQLCLTLCNPPGSSVHGIFQARILEQATLSYSRRSSQPTDQTWVSGVSCIGRWILYH